MSFFVESLIPFLSYDKGLEVFNTFAMNLIPNKDKAQIPALFLAVPKLRDIASLDGLAALGAAVAIVGNPEDVQRFEAEVLNPIKDEQAKDLFDLMGRFVLSSGEATKVEAYFAKFVDKLKNVWMRTLAAEMLRIEFDRQRGIPEFKMVEVVREWSRHFADKELEDRVLPLHSAA
jgi:hypothetical protein